MCLLFWGSRVLLVKLYMNRQMGARVPVQQYNLRSGDPYIDGTSLHDLNTVDGRGGEIIEPMVDRDAVTDGSLDNEDDSGAVVSFN